MGDDRIISPPTGAVALSGGIDSAAALLLMLEQGMSAAAGFMRHRYQPVISMDDADAERFSSSVQAFRLGETLDLEPFRWTPDRFPLPRDAWRAFQIARALSVPLTFIDVDPIFEGIVEQFTASYLMAQTPNPCVECNRRLKFGAFARVLLSLFPSWFATGHYLRVLSLGELLVEMDQNDLETLPVWIKGGAPSQTLLLRSRSHKDQSYVLWDIDPEILPRLRFPLGRFPSKEETLRFLADHPLPITFEGESQDICFVPDGTHSEFIRSRVGNLDTAGDFVSPSGEVIGRHSGYEKYTVGQRKGLGMGFGERIFVQKIDARSHQVTLGERSLLAVSTVRAMKTNWLFPVPNNEPFPCQVKLRYRSRALGAFVTAFDDGTLLAQLNEPFFGAAPGQSLVCYWGDILLGGGVICAPDEG